MYTDFGAITNRNAAKSRFTEVAMMKTLLFSPVYTDFEEANPSSV